MNMREQLELREKNRFQRELLIKEGMSGETPRDTLPNSAPPLQDENEAMYFKELREMMKKAIIHRVFDSKQDCVEVQDASGLCRIV